MTNKRPYTFAEATASQKPEQSILTDSQKNGVKNIPATYFAKDSDLTAANARISTNETDIANLKKVTPSAEFIVQSTTTSGAYSTARVEGKVMKLAASNGRYFYLYKTINYRDRNLHYFTAVDGLTTSLIIVTEYRTPSTIVGIGEEQTFDAAEKVDEKVESDSVVVRGEGELSVVENGKNNTASGQYSHAEGYGTTASAADGHAEGLETTASNGNAAHAEGYKSKSTAWAAHAEGGNTEANAENSHAEGNYSKADGVTSHAEGYYTDAKAYYSHAEGSHTKATASASHAEGGYTEASGGDSHAEGGYTKASGNQSHAEGGNTEASSHCAHAEGYGTKASGSYSHAEGYYTEAIGNYQHVFGKFNATDESAAEIVGGGTDDVQQNIRTLDWSGNEKISGKHYGYGNPVSLEDQIAAKADASETTAALALKANASDVYSKSAVDSMLVNKVDGDTFVEYKEHTEAALATKANKTEVNTALDTKANSADVYTKSETYNNEEVESKLSVKADTADVPVLDPSYTAGDYTKAATCASIAQAIAAATLNPSQFAVDQTYNANSTNAQSGKAVAEAVREFKSLTKYENNSKYFKVFSFVKNNTGNGYVFLFTNRDGSEIDSKFIVTIGNTANSSATDVSKIKIDCLRIGKVNVGSPTSYLPKFFVAQNSKKNLWDLIVQVGGYSWNTISILSRATEIHDFGFEVYESLPEAYASASYREVVTSGFAKAIGSASVPVYVDHSGEINACTSIATSTYSATGAQAVNGTAVAAALAGGTAVAKNVGCTTLTSSNNLDSLDSPIGLSIYSWASSSYAINCPRTDKDSIMENLKYSDNFIVQKIFLDGVVDKYWLRSKSGSSWSSWRIVNV